MAQTITLHRPLLVNGKERIDLTYDFDEISVQLYMDANVATRRSCETTFSVAEFDYILHFFIGCAAVIAVNPEIDFVDMEQIKGSDIMQIVGIGRNFTTGLESRTDETSDEQ